MSRSPSRVWCIRCKKNRTLTPVHPTRNLCLEHCIAHDAEPTRASAKATASERHAADRIDGYDRDDLGESPDY